MFKSSTSCSANDLVNCSKQSMLSDNRPNRGLQRPLSDPVAGNNSRVRKIWNKKNIPKIMRRGSSVSERSDSKPREFIHTVGKTIFRTQSTLRRSHLIHVFYIVALLLYTVLGALIFQALDGEHDERMLEAHEKRCRYLQTENWARLQANCSGKAFDDCSTQIDLLVKAVDNCYRKWHETHRDITYSLSNFTNSLIFALSIYTTIGYGNIAADSFGCRLATIFYAIFGVPLFYAFLKDMCNLFRHLFMKLWNLGVTMCLSLRESCYCGGSTSDGDISIAGALSIPVPVILAPSRATVCNEEDDTSISDVESIHNPQYPPSKYNRSRRLTDDSVNGILPTVIEQRKIFIAAVSFFIVYLFAVSGVFCLMEDWDFFTAFYFMFHSVALIGFGDVFPDEPKVVLINCAFIVVGIILFGMCYIILSEEIREKALVASTRARRSISKYRHNLLQANFIQDIWSRRNSPSELTTGRRRKTGKRRKSEPAITLHMVKNGTAQSSRV